MCISMSLRGSSWQHHVNQVKEVRPGLFPSWLRLSLFFFFPVLSFGSLQITNKDVFKVSEERAFADFLICNLLLQLAVFNYIG